VIRHIALLRWTDDAGRTEIEGVSATLARLPDLIPQLRAYRFGPDLELAAGNWDFAVVADFASREDWATYMVHPDHQAVLTERIQPILAERAAVQFEY
jgi:hypothetical protein